MISKTIIRFLEANVNSIEIKDPARSKMSEIIISIFHIQLPLNKNVFTQFPLFLMLIASRRPDEEAQNVLIKYPKDSYFYNDHQQSLVRTTLKLAT